MASQQKLGCISERRAGISGADPGRPGAPGTHLIHKREGLVVGLAVALPVPRGQRRCFGLVTF